MRPFEFRPRSLWLGVQPAALVNGDEKDSTMSSRQAVGTVYASVGWKYTRNILVSSGSGLMD